MPPSPSPELTAQALERSLHALLGTLLTEPMTVSRLAVWFDVNRQTMKVMLEAMPNTERVGGLWRVSVWKMPPRYHLDRGLLTSVSLPNCA